MPDAVFVQRDLTRAEPPPPEHGGWATHAVCSEVLEHVDDPGGLLEVSRRYLAPGCRLVVTVPGGPMTAYDRHIGHRRHFQPRELADLLRGAGFDVLRATGAGFPVFNLYRLLMRALGNAADRCRWLEEAVSRLAGGYGYVRGVPAFEHEVVASRLAGRRSSAQLRAPRRRSARGVVLPFDSVSR